MPTEDSKSKDQTEERRGLRWFLTNQHALYMAFSLIAGLVALTASILELFGIKLESDGEFAKIVVIAGSATMAVLLSYYFGRKKGGDSAMSWPSFQQITVGFAILGALFALMQQRKQPGGHQLEKVVVKLLAASSIPTGVLLLGCAFNASWIAKLNDLGIYLAAAAVALLFVSLKELIKR